MGALGVHKLFNLALFICTCYPHCVNKKLGKRLTKFTSRLLFIEVEEQYLFLVHVASLDTGSTTLNGTEALINFVN